MRFLISIAVLPLLVQTTTAFGQPARPSDYRDGVKVELLYDQKLEGVYSTSWWGRLEKQVGAWRDVYFETGEKYNNKGVLSFNCSRSKNNIGVITYSFGEYDADDRKHVVIVRPSEQASWAKGRFEPLQGEDPPFALYARAKKRFC